MNDKPKNAPADTDAWIATEVGQTLKGEVVDVDTAWSKWRERANQSDPNAGWYPLLTIKEDGTGTIYKLHGFRTVLFNELVKRAPIPGETIIVEYKGPGEAKDGMNPPEIYRVHVEGRSPEAAKDIYKNLVGGRTLQTSTVTEDVPEPAQEEIPY